MRPSQSSSSLLASVQPGSTTIELSSAELQLLQAAVRGGDLTRRRRRRHHRCRSELQPECGRGRDQHQADPREKLAIDSRISLFLFGGSCGAGAKQPVRTSFRVRQRRRRSSAGCTALPRARTRRRSERVRLMPSATGQRCA
jgi:hypothetical protein